MLVFLSVLLIGCACADDAQWINVKSGVKGGHGGGYPYYNPGANYNSFFESKQGQEYGTSGMRHNMTLYGSQNATHGYGARNTSRIDFEVGVCYIEVPTVTLVRDPSSVPAGNGSRPDLSRIRTCCKGYIKNIHNFKICDPVCTVECVNALCTAPNTCSCFPDHVKNLAGFCIPTCPIGCQNGHCSGGECLCKEGYKLDADSKYCAPSCRQNCGGIGNCTQPNICECKAGYQSTPEGNCKPVCDQCTNGDCVAPNDCRCKPGYKKNYLGKCEPDCPQGCGQNGRCVAPNVCSSPSTTPHSQPAFPPYYIPNQQNNTLYPGNQIQNGTYGNPRNNTIPAHRGDIDSYTQNTPRNQLYPDNLITGQQGQAGYNSQTGHQGQTGYQEQTGYQGQTQQQWQSVNQGQAGYEWQTENQGYHTQNGYQGTRGHHEQSGYHGQARNEGQSVYYGQSGYERQTGSQRPQPGSQYPGSQYPGSQYPEPQYPVSTNQESQYPGSQYPGSHYPGFQYPGSLYPVSQHPGSQYSGSQYPGAQYPGQPSQNQTGHSGNPGSQQPLIPDSQVQCSTPCFNGICVEGNTCHCNPGYVLDTEDTTGTRCVPYCPGGCPNGVCSAPHFCICNLGYRKDTSVKGRTGCVKRIRRNV